MPLFGTNSRDLSSGRIGLILTRLNITSQLFTNYFTTYNLNFTTYNLNFTIHTSPQALSNN
jgi:hypothetical protein